MGSGGSPNGKRAKREHKKKKKKKKKGPKATYLFKEEKKGKLQMSRGVIRSRSGDQSSESPKRGVRERGIKKGKTRGYVPEAKKLTSRVPHRTVSCSLLADTAKAKKQGGKQPCTRRTYQRQVVDQKDGQFNNQKKKKAKRPIHRRKEQ